MGQTVHHLPIHSDDACHSPNMSSWLLLSNSPASSEERTDGTDSTDGSWDATKANDAES